LKGEGDAILPLASQTAEPGWEARWDRDKTLARLAWVEVIRIVYGAGLRLAGITALERMDRSSTGDGDRHPPSPSTRAGGEGEADDEGPADAEPRPASSDEEARGQ
jgi:arginyl-tRNA synthetase